jgi:hypothetical protein
MARPVKVSLAFNDAQGRTISKQIYYAGTFPSITIWSIVGVSDPPVFSIEIANASPLETGIGTSWISAGEAESFRPFISARPFGVPPCNTQSWYCLPGGGGGIF